MNYSYNLFGWYDGIKENLSRTTTLQPSIMSSPVVGQEYPNWTGQAWENIPYSLPRQDLTTLKAKKNSQINTWRAFANQSVFTHGGKVIACDQLSRSDIDAVAGSVAMNGTFPVGFPLAWKAVDNSYLSLPDVAAFKAMYNSMTLQGTINFGRSQELKTMLSSATSESEIQSIVW